jgi:hypothetical protein
MEWSITDKWFVLIWFLVAPASILVFCCCVIYLWFLTAIERAFGYLWTKSIYPPLAPLCLAF